MPSTTSSSNSKKAEKFETLDAKQVSGVAQHVVYGIDNPVSIPAKGSAVVPIASLPILGDRVLVYDPKMDDVCAKRAIHLHNNTKTVLAPGVVSVYEGSCFVAQTDFVPMPPDDDQLIFFGDDSTVDISLEKESKRRITGVDILYKNNDVGKRVATGVEVVYTHTIVTQYRIRNNSAHDPVPTIYIDHSASNEHGGYAIQNKDDFCAKATAGFTRFQFSLDVGEERMYSVTEVALTRKQMTTRKSLVSFLDSAQSLLSKSILRKDVYNAATQLLAGLQEMEELHTIIADEVTDAMVREWLASEQEAQNMDSREIRKQAIAIHKLQKRRSDVREEIALRNSHVEKVFTNQARLRENIKSLEQLTESSLVKRYLKDLDHEEDDLMATRNLLDQYQAELQELNSVVKDARLSLTALCNKRLASLESLHR